MKRLRECTRRGFGPQAGLLLAALVLSSPTILFAAEEVAPPPRPNFTMEEIEIRGETERPGVFYIIPRREVQMDLGSRHKDYTSEIMEPLLPGPSPRQLRAGDSK